MKQYRDNKDLGMCMNAEDIQRALGISRAFAYQLMHSNGFPTIVIGKRMVVPRDKFLQWMDECVENRTSF